MPLYYISNAHNLLLCDVLFSDTTGLIDFIDRYPSVKRQERGMDYIIKLYEEQNSLNKGIKGNKTEVKGSFVAFCCFMRMKFHAFFVRVSFHWMICSLFAKRILSI